MFFDALNPGIVPLPCGDSHRGQRDLGHRAAVALSIAGVESRGLRVQLLAALAGSSGEHDSFGFRAEQQQLTSERRRQTLPRSGWWAPGRRKWACCHASPIAAGPMTSCLTTSTLRSIEMHSVTITYRGVRSHVVVPAEGETSETSNFGKGSSRHVFVVTCGPNGLHRNPSLRRVKCQPHNPRFCAKGEWF